MHTQVSHTPLYLVFIFITKDHVVCVCARMRTDYYLYEPCDLDPEDSKSMFLHGTLVHDNSSLYKEDLEVKKILFGQTFNEILSL